MFLVTYFAVFVLSHNENTHLYSFGIEWVRDIKWDCGGKIGSAAVTRTKWTLSYENMRVLNELSPKLGRESFKSGLKHLLECTFAFFAIHFTWEYLSHL